MQYGGSATGAIFAAVRRQIDSALAKRSDKIAVDAYMTFEQVETAIRANNPGLASELEGNFAWLRTRALKADDAERHTIRERLLADLERAERVVADRPSGASLFVNSFFLLIREGFEAILIVAALMTFLTKAGAPERRREVARGAWIAVGASVLTWVLVELLLQVTPGQREIIEGGTMLLAATVLFYVSYWRSEEHTSELQSPCNLVCRLLLEKKKKCRIPSLTCSCRVNCCRHCLLYSSHHQSLGQYHPVRL